MDTMHLPDGKDLKALGKIYRNYLDDAQHDQNIAAVEWFIVRHYLRGCRYFDTLEYDTGKVRPTYFNVRGGVPFKFEEIINKCVTELGRLLRLDVAPAVTKNSVGLDSLRKESIAQATLDSVYPHLDPESTKRNFFDMLVQYGVAGLFAYQASKEESDPDDPTSNIHIEVVPPWELLFLPSSARNPAEVKSIARVRWVSLRWLETIEVDGKKLDIPKEDDKDLLVRYTTPGYGVPDIEGRDVAFRSIRGKTQKGKSLVSQKSEKDPDAEPFVKLQEIFMRYQNGRMQRYSIMLGNLCVYDKKYKNNKDAPYMPLGHAVRGPGLYGRGFIGPMVGLNQEIEAAVQNLLRNVQDLSLFGLTGIPVSWDVDELDLDSAVSSGRRFFHYDPDPTQPNVKMEHIEPKTSGLLPEKIINLSIGLMDRMSQQPEIVTQGSAPGRVESTPALNFLYQASTVPLGAIASSIADAYGTVYKAILGFTKSWKNITLNMQTLLDNAVIGIVFDPKSGTMKFSENIIPESIELSVGIKSQKPIDRDAKKAELYELQQRQLISEIEFKIQARLLKLDMPLGNDSEWENYRMATLRNVILFNDGETPGELDSSIGPSDYDNPEVQLMVVQRLMASPEFALASTLVQDKFEELVKHLRAMGGQYPEEMVYPEAEAEMGGAVPPAGPGLEAIAGGAIPAGTGQDAIEQALQSLGGAPGGIAPGATSE